MPYFNDIYSSTSGESKLDMNFIEPKLRLLHFFRIYYTGRCTANCTKTYNMFYIFCLTFSPTNRFCGVWP